MNKMSQNETIQEQPLAVNWIDSIGFRILLTTILALGVFFRLGGLGNKIYSHDEIYTSLYAIGYRGGDVFDSLWDGKTKTVENLQKFLKPNEDKNFTEILSLMALYRPHQAPLFFMMEHYWMKVIGYTPSAMRGLSAIFGIFSIPAMYWFGKELFKFSHIAVLATAFFAISPYHILFAQDARPYSLWALITLLSSASLLQAMRKQNTGTWMIYSVTLIVGVYSHQLFILVAVTHGMYFMGIHFMNNQNKYGEFLLAWLFAFLVYTPWLFFIITRFQVVARQTDVLSMQLPWYRYIQRWILFFSSPLIDIDFNSNTGNLMPYLLRVLVLAIIAYAFLFLLKRGSQQEKLFLPLIYIVTAGTFIVLDMLFGGIRSITGRYYVPANIATIMVVAYFLAKKLDQAQAKSYVKWSRVVGLLMLVGIFSNVNSLLAETWWNKELSRVQTEFVHEINRDQTLLIVSGSHPTNLGDILLLGFAVDRDVYFRLYQDPVDIKYPLNYQNVYWFPSTYDEVLEIGEREKFEVTEVLQGTLWRIERR